MSGFTPAEEVVGLPGYLATLRLSHGTPGTGMFRPAWSKLELFPTVAAEDFLKPKFEKALKMEDKEAALEALVEIGLGFGIMAVFADRENSEYIEEMAERARTVSEGQNADREIERESIDGPEPIDW